MHDKQSKKALKAKYKDVKPEMGVFLFRCKVTGNGYVGWAQNVKGKINSITFRLESGSFYRHNLQQEWTQHGRDSFTVETVELLEYDKDVLKTDYSEDLAALRELCMDRLEGVEAI